VIATNGNCTDTTFIAVTVNPLPAANAGTDVTVAYGQSVQIGALGGTSYVWSPSAGLSCSNCQNPSANPLVTTDYIVTVTDANGCTDTDTINVFVDETCTVIYLPNAISPNGDGENDELRIYINNLLCIVDFKISFFDRWGEKVFQSTNKDFRWDGTYAKILDSEPLGTAVFVYRMDAEMYDGKKIKRTGNVSLIR